MIQTQPYSILAEIYDCIMKDVPYKKWAKYILKLIKKFNPKTTHILELACGTGTMISLLTKFGFKVDGVDISEKMIQKAREKIKNEDVNLYIADMSEFKTDKKYGSVLCLYDSINYLTEIGKILNLFSNVWSLLDEDGIFIFDISTEYNSIQNAIAMNTKGKCGDYKFVRRSYFLRDERTHINEFEIEKDKEKFFEKHIQRIYKISEIEDAVKKTGLFEVVARYKNFTFSEGNEWSERVHFILKKVKV
jgi:SAM-dependent methyltransferase